MPQRHVHVELYVCGSCLSKGEYLLLWRRDHRSGGGEVLPPAAIGVIPLADAGDMSEFAVEVADALEGDGVCGEEGVVFHDSSMRKVK